jgi:fructose-1,6-bisphosphatase/inositol monophosphatase family enzyme
MIEEVPRVRAQFERVGGGSVLNNSPYDLAAAALCAREAGAVVTDASGRPLDNRPLLGSGVEFQMSCITSASEELHAQLIEEVDRGIARLRAQAAATAP